MSASGAPALPLFFDVSLRPLAAQFVPLAADDYLREAFLDQRLLHGGRRIPQMIPIETLEQQLGSFSAPEQPRFIFHLGHVGSTLVSRLLAAAPTVLPVREPPVLRTLAFSEFSKSEPESLVAPDVHAKLLRLAVQSFSRPFHERSLPIVKATSTASLLAGQVAALTPAPLLGLTATARTYLATILGADGNRQEAVAFAPIRRQMVGRHLPDAAFAVHELSEGELIAMGWLAGALDLAGLKAATDARTMLQDFSTFLDAPAETLLKISEHLGAGLTGDTAAAATSGPIMSRYSKAQEHGYSTDLRSQVLAGALQQHGTEIDRGLRWLDGLAARHEAAAKAIETVGLG